MKVLIIDDEMNICLTLKNILEDEGYECDHALDSKIGMNKFENMTPDVVLLDVRLDGTNGIDLLKDMKKLREDVIVIMISGHSGIKEAVQSIKYGAYDFLEKPLSLTKVKIILKKAIEFSNISKDYSRLKSNENEKYKIIGNSQPIKELLSLIDRIAASDSKVLVRGESGTGKELVAYAIHHRSSRRDKPFAKFNSAAIPTELVESELFGYEKGAFTGAVGNKSGKIEQAHGGTLFLDEIGDMSLKAQSKILRVIQEGEFERVGSNKTQKIDIRLVAATHKDLEDLVQKGEFREDLYYRLNVIPITTPPLRQHPEDIPVLVNYFSNQFSNELKLPLKEFLPDTINELRSWEFKGNIRELKNFIERLYILIPKTVIELEDIKSMSTATQSDSNFWNETLSLKEKRKVFETKYLSIQLKLNDGNISRTAEALDLQVSNLSRKLKELEIN
ncbi:MAG: sigma-54-dependent Fis family transcriptional regulator [Candidatus Cloacimonetes bacterium]|nr:sigma-54-dependent Fis family transcriptional regulator [Candidatus Cloacimonadota bacterium]MBT5420849.1 sigma-54-dependent Fis family transcriptional regulator [Candidatus Cloacimonadota bacterium]